MNAFLIASAILFAVSSARAEGPAPCATRATESKLAGPALRAFMIKCERDAKSACDASAREQKLDGTAFANFTTKCMRDTVGQ